MQDLRDIVRSRVDDLRSTGGSRARDAASLVAALSEKLAVNVRRASDGREHGDLHVCPWHTCQATRHN